MLSLCRKTIAIVFFLTIFCDQIASAQDSAITFSPVENFVFAPCAGDLMDLAPEAFDENGESLSVSFELHNFSAQGLQMAPAVASPNGEFFLADFLDEELDRSYEVEYAYQIEDEINETVNIVGRFHSELDPLAVVEVEIILNEARNWEEWISVGPFQRDYKDDFDIVTTEYLDWTYMELLSGSITGYGSLAGTHLELSHAPANYFYGYQMGHGAHNGGSLNLGSGGWFFISGGEAFYEGNSVPANGQGDVILEQGPAGGYASTIVWTAADANGNQNSVSQKIYFQQCDYPNVPGCTDIESNNYMPIASVDDGSCFGCKVDFDADGNVGAADMTILLQHFGSNCDGSCVTDVNEDGATNGEDLMQFIARFGGGCN